MAVNERTFVRIVPESTGDRINFYHTWDIEYSGKTGTFSVGDTVVGSLSGVQAIILKDTPDNDVATSGVLSTILLPGFEAKFNTVGEDLEVASVAIATVTTAYCVYINTSTLVGGNNPKYRQYIDAEGQAFVRFGEGTPQFDAFGKMQISEATTVAEHILEYGLHSDDFTDITSGGGSIAHQPNHAGALLSCGTASGDKIERISNRYCKYQAGKSHLIETTVAIGDSGKANVERIWGYGDESDGLFFHLNEATFHFMVRNSSSGSVVETDIMQTDWNMDRLDGSGDSRNISGHLLDFTKDNIYWVDFQWLGAGRVRFGVVIDGKRITCHEQYHANLVSLPYMRTGTLPLYARQENTGVAASSSEMRVWCMVAKTEGSYEPPVKHFSGSVTGKTVTTPACAVSFRSKQTFQGLNNRIVAFGENFDFFTDTEPCLVELVKNGTLGGTPTWANSPGADSSVEFDTAGTTVTGGTVLDSWIIGTGAPRPLDIGHIFGHDGEGLSRKAVITDTPDIFSVNITRLSGTTTDISLTASWNEAQ